MPDIISGKVWVDGERGVTASKMNSEFTGAVIQPDFVSAKPSTSTVAATDQMLVLKTDNTYARAPFSTISSSVAGQLPLADNTQNGMLRQVSGLTTDLVDGTNHCVNPAAMPGITQMRLRSFQSIGNSTFEVDQRNVGTLLANPASGAFCLDRWQMFKSGTMVMSTQQAIQGYGSGIVIPGTGFKISNSFLGITLTTQQASLAAGDYWFFSQSIEGPMLRELSMDVSSVSLLVASSVAGLKFSVTIRDPAAVTKSLVKLCTIPNASTWTLISLPNIPQFPSGNFSLTPGAVGYSLGICLAAGTTYTASAADTFQNGNFLAAPGADNFASKPVGSSFQVAFVQHEPGPFSTTPQDLSFGTNLDGPMGCTRYYQKSYGYAVKAGTVDSNGQSTLYVPAAAYAWGPISFSKRMAKIPTVTCYSPATGAINTARDLSAATDRGVSAPVYMGDTGFGGGSLTSTNAGAAAYGLHWTADTSW